VLNDLATYVTQQTHSLNLLHIHSSGQRRMIPSEGMPRTAKPGTLAPHTLKRTPSWPLTAHGTELLRSVCLSDEYGDLIVTFNVLFPTMLNQRQKQMLHSALEGCEYNFNQPS